MHARTHASEAGFPDVGSIISKGELQPPIPPWHTPRPRYSLKVLVTVITLKQACAGAGAGGGGLESSETDPMFQIDRAQRENHASAW